MNRIAPRLVALRRVVLQKRNAGHGHHEVNPGPPITYDYAPVPFQSYQKVHGELNAKFNMYLAISATLCALSFAWAFKSDVFAVEAAWLPPRSYRQRNSQ